MEESGGESGMSLNLMRLTLEFGVVRVDVWVCGCAAV
jgi:hypothetical protein